MNQRHSSVLQSLRTRPLPKSMRWADVARALEAADARIEYRSGMTVHVEYRGRHLTLHTDVHKELRPGTIKALSELLASAEHPAVHAPPSAVVVSTHKGVARVWKDRPPEIAPPDSEPAPVRAPEPTREESPTMALPLPTEFRVEAVAPDGSRHAIVFDALDAPLLQRCFDLERVRVGQQRARGPYVLPRDIRNSALRAAVDRRGLAQVQVAQVLLGLEPGSARVRFINGDAHDLRRANLRVYADRLEPRRRKAVAPAEPVVEAPLPVRPPSYEIALVHKPVYVVRVNGRDASQHATEAEAKLALADILTR